jgi:uncharacterized membrane protein (UPF0127 family)
MKGLQPVWLVSDGRVLAAALRATERSDRRRGLIGATSIDQPLVIEPCNWVHTFGMKVAIDVAFVSADNLVMSVETLKPWRVGPYTRGAARVIEASAGSLDRWNIGIGSKVEVRDVEQ